MAAWGHQFKTGDQDDATRRKFWATLCTVCPKCEKKNITEEKTAAACRMNGDAYGTTVFTCKDCGWHTSFQWDDHGDNYWYETVGWQINPDARSSS
jgi:hypothetical protein